MVVPARRIAAFDFDGTLTRRDTLLPFLVRACGAHRVTLAVSRAAPTAARARVGRLEAELHHRDATKERLLFDLFRRRPARWLAHQGRDFATTLPSRLRPEMVRRVRWHRAQGHELVIVSASLTSYLEPFAEHNCFDHVIAVGLEVDDDGLLTGHMDGPNVRGGEKERRLREWLAGDPARIWAYGNSTGDAELLAMADQPTWVGRRS